MLKELVAGLMLCKEETNLKHVCQRDQYLPKWKSSPTALPHQMSDVDIRQQAKWHLNTIWVWHIIHAYLYQQFDIHFTSRSSLQQKMAWVVKDGLSLCRKSRHKDTKWYKKIKVSKREEIVWTPWGSLLHQSSVRQLCKEDKRTTGILRDKYNDASMGLARAHMSTPATWACQRCQTGKERRGNI